MVKQRILTALWLTPLAMAAIWFGDFPFLIAFCVALIALLAMREFYRMASGIRVQPQTLFGIIFSLLLIFSRDPRVAEHLRDVWGIDNFVSILLTAGVLFSLFLLLARRQKTNALSGWAWTWAGILYIGWLLSYMAPLRALEDGRNWLYLACFCTFASDTTAFFVGRAFGRHKLAPTISPKKTREGALGGIFGAAAISLFFLLPTPLSLAAQLSWWQALTLGVLISLIGQSGDLVESMLKRNTDSKDSGTIFPGHGGALDRIDSIMFAIVLVYYWVIWITP